MVLVVSNDLMSTAPIERAARLAGSECQVIPPSAFSESLAEPPRVAILDLNATDDVAALVDSIRSALGPEIPFIAFGPHVHENKLEAAAEAGCSQVLTRGQFHRDMNQLISTLLRP